MINPCYYIIVVYYRHICDSAYIICIGYPPYSFPSLEPTDLFKSPMPTSIFQLTNSDAGSILDL